MYSVERLLRVVKDEENPCATLDYPIEHIAACHGRIEERLAILEHAGDFLETNPAEALTAIASTFAYFESSGTIHKADVEQSIFPRLRPHLTPAELAEIEILETKHREADGIYAALKSVVEELEGMPRSSELRLRYTSLVERFNALYRAHIEFENRELVRMARRNLTSGDLAAISAEMKSRRGLAAKVT
ncbi:MAG: hemerythrin domain-containing protein [Bryobacteraceae bacterium]